MAPAVNVTTLEEAIQAYLIYCDYRGLAGRTIERYRRELNTLPEAWPLTPLAVQRHLTVLRERGLAFSSIDMYLRSIRAFCRWAVQAEFLEKDPTVGIKIRVPRSLPRIPTQADVQALLRTCTRSREAVKYRAVILLFVDTGLRISELCRLRWEDLQPATRQLTVRSGKGGKDDTLYYGATTAQALNKWAGARGIIEREAWVFPGIDDRRTRRSSIDWMLRNLSKQAHLPRPISAHKLRHFYATELLRRGTDLETVRKLMRHSSYAMVTRYLHLLGPDLARAHRRASPADWLDR